MHIKVSRSGGYAGLEEGLGTLDTNTLDGDRAAEIERLVQYAGFFELPATLPDDSVGADLFQYSITVTDHGRSHTVSYRDSGADLTTGGSEAAGSLPVLRRLVDAAQQH